MDSDQLIILITVLVLMTSYGFRHRLKKLANWWLDFFRTPSLPAPPIRPHFRIKLPVTMDFDGAIVTVTAGGKRLTQVNPQQAGVGTGKILHFDLAGENQVDLVEIYTPRDDKKYDFLAPAVNSTFEMPLPMAQFDYYQPTYHQRQGL